MLSNTFHSFFLFSFFFLPSLNLLSLYGIKVCKIFSNAGKPTSFLRHSNDYCHLYSDKIITLNWSLGSSNIISFHHTQSPIQFLPSLYILWKKIFVCFKKIIYHLLNAVNIEFTCCMWIKHCCLIYMLSFMCSCRLYSK